MADDPMLTVKVPVSRSIVESTSEDGLAALIGPMAAKVAKTAVAKTAVEEAGLDG